MVDSFTSFFNEADGVPPLTPSAPAANTQQSQQQQTPDWRTRAINAINNPNFATRLLSRMGGHKAGNREVTKEFTVTSLEALINAINASGTKGILKDRLVLPVANITPKEIPQDILTNINNTLQKDITDNDSISIVTPTKEDSVTISKINGTWYAFETKGLDTGKYSYTVPTLTKLIDFINASGTGDLIADRKTLSTQLLTLQNCERYGIPVDTWKKISELLPRIQRDQKITITSASGSEGVTIAYFGDKAGWQIFSTVATPPVVNISNIDPLIEALNKKELENIDRVKNGGNDLRPEEYKYPGGKTTPVTTYYMPINKTPPDTQEYLFNQTAESFEEFSNMQSLFEADTTVTKQEDFTSNTEAFYESIRDDQAKKKIIQLISSLKGANSIEIKGTSLPWPINIGYIGTRLYVYTKIPRVFYKNINDGYAKAFGTSTPKQSKPHRGGKPKVVKPNVSPSDEPLKPDTKEPAPTSATPRTPGSAGTTGTNNRFGFTSRDFGGKTKPPMKRAEPVGEPVTTNPRLTAGTPLELVPGRRKRRKTGELPPAPKRPKPPMKNVTPKRRKPKTAKGSKPLGLPSPKVLESFNDYFFNKIV